MLITSSPPPTYKSYKNEKFTRHIDKIKKQIQQINECSLRADDKILLKKQLIKLIEPVKI